MGIPTRGELYRLSVQTFNNTILPQNGYTSIAPSDLPPLLHSFLDKNTKQWGKPDAVYVDSADTDTMTEIEKYVRLYGSINGSNATNKYICGMVAQDRPSKHVFASSFVNDGCAMIGQLTIATNGDINITPYKHSHSAINVYWYVD